MIKDAITARFPKHVWSRYIKEFSFSPSQDTLYTSALSSLNKGETEKSITYLIMLFDRDIKYEPGHHLARLMLFSLSEEFVKRKGHNVKEKHPDLNKYLLKLEEKVEKIEQEIISTQNSISKLEGKIKDTSFIGSILKGKENKQNIRELKTQVENLTQELSNTKKEITMISDISKIEEYTKIIALVLEIVTHPKRFSIMNRNQQ